MLIKEGFVSLLFPFFDIIHCFKSDKSSFVDIKYQDQSPEGFEIVQSSLLSINRVEFRLINQCRQCGAKD